jgi:ATP-dependent Lon protease
MPFVKRLNFSESESNSDSDSEYVPGVEDEEEEVLDRKEYQKFLMELFPSKYLKNKIKETEEEEDYDEEDEGDMPVNIVLNINGLQNRDEDEDEGEDDDYDDEDEGDEGDEEDEGDFSVMPVNIVLNISGLQNHEEDEDEGDDEGDEEEEEEEEAEEEEKKEEEYSSKDIEDLISLIKTMKEDGNDVLLEKFEKIEAKTKKEEDKKQKKIEKKEKKKNIKEFRKYSKPENYMNDVSYFNKCSVEDQKDIIEKFKAIQEKKENIIPYKISLIHSIIPNEYKYIALRKINALKTMDPHSGEYNKIKTWLDNFMMIPFGTYRELGTSIKDGREKCSEFMLNAKKTLDEAVYGLNDAKMQILQMMGQWITNPNSVASAIAIKGPMGTGKTTLIKEGVSKILNRPFAFIALGGATDSSYLEGHSYTYEGSTWGHIVEILRQSKCMNPIIYFDELDKVSDTPRGEEIIGVLTHLTDTSQNSQFHDKYFSGIDFDLSKCLFIFSYNDENKVNPILRDRMYKIHTEGYKMVEKKVIAKNYLIPAVERNIGFEGGMLELKDKEIGHIIEKYTKGEKGVRNLKRCIEILYTKINMFRLMEVGTKLYDKFEITDMKFPYTFDSERVSSLLKKDKEAEFIMSLYT